MRLIKSICRGQALQLLVVFLFASSPAYADFGPDATYALWHLAAYATALVLLPLLAPTGWRVFWLACALVGYPISYSILSNLTGWVSRDYYTNFRITAWMTLITWAWIACALAWARFFRLELLTESTEAAATRTMPRSIDIVVVLFIICLVVDCQSLLPRIGNASPHSLLPVIAFAVLSLVAAMGLWYRKWWAFGLAIACAVAGIALEMRLDPQAFAWLRGNSVASKEYLTLWLEHSVLIATLLRVFIVSLLILPVRAQLRHAQ